MWYVKHLSWCLLTVTTIKINVFDYDCYWSPQSHLTSVSFCSSCCQFTCCDWHNRYLFWACIHVLERLRYCLHYHLIEVDLSEFCSFFFPLSHQVRWIKAYNRDSLRGLRPPSFPSQHLVSKKEESQPIDSFYSAGIILHHLFIG